MERPSWDLWIPDNRCKFLSLSVCVCVCVCAWALSRRISSFHHIPVSSVIKRGITTELAIGIYPKYFHLGDQVTRNHFDHCYLIGYFNW